jgi:uncharacterized Zn finger protein (UPF0148 family)
MTHHICERCKIALVETKVPKVYKCPMCNVIVNLRLK